MAGELEILRSQDRRRKEKIANMEAALDKVVFVSIRPFILFAFLYQFLCSEDICIFICATAYTFYSPVLYVLQNEVTAIKALP